MVDIKFRRLPKLPDRTLPDHKRMVVREIISVLLPHVAPTTLQAMGYNDLCGELLECLTLGVVGESHLPKRGAMPTRARATDAGIDIYADHDVELKGAGGLAVIDTGIAWQCPTGWYAQIQDRSSMGGKGITYHGGVIDSSYRGEWKVVLCNHGDAPYRVKRGDKICQAVILPVPPINILEVDRLEDSERGDLGFGSSGR